VKRTIPLLITGVVGMLMIVVYFIPPMKELTEYAQRFFQVLLTFSLVLGAVSLLSSHGKKIFKFRQGWGYSLVLIVSFLATLVLGLGKIGVPPQYGLGAFAEQNGLVAQFHLTGKAETGRTFRAEVIGGEPAASLPLFVGDTQVGALEFDDRRKAVFAAATELPPLTQTDAAPPDVDNPWLYEIYVPERVTPPEVRGEELPTFTPVEVRVGDALTAQLDRYGPLTGDYNWNGGPAWWIYKYVYLPLAATMFAMLAFYVASAAFRAFRARNAESVVLLLTAFLILAGRTFVGAWLTMALPEEGFWSFFRIENLTSWIMLTFNTAGNRAILIGIALGIAATSLKVILGIDRSYLGSEQ
jgi:hypothetical protein